jgi:hypothetical protein
MFPQPSYWSGTGSDRTSLEVAEAIGAIAGEHPLSALSAKRTFVRTNVRLGSRAEISVAALAIRSEIQFSQDVLRERQESDFVSPHVRRGTHEYTFKFYCITKYL